MFCKSVVKMENALLVNNNFDLKLSFPFEIVERLAKIF